jgi:putative SOS response-associated peptidase YedK
LIKLPEPTQSGIDADQLPKRQPMAFAGALGRFKWPDGTALRTFTIVTTTTNETVSETMRRWGERP